VFELPDQIGQASHAPALTDATRGLMDSQPEVLICLDHPATHPTTDEMRVAGWIASPTPIESVQLVRLDGSRSTLLKIVERDDARRANPRHAHVVGFSDQLPLSWAPDARIELVCVTGGREQRLVRTLAHTLDLAAKTKKLDRIAGVLRHDLSGRRKLYHFDFLSAALREDYRIVDTAAVSSNDYDGIALDLIARNPDGLILDAGAGFRKNYLPNVVNFEIAPYPSTDVLGVGEELPFVDHAFDAVFSLAVLEHVKDPFKCARELSRVLKPGGTLYAAVPFLQHYHGYPHHYYNMTHQGLANLFAGRLDIKEQKVLASGYPIWTLCWFLQIYAANLPPEERAKFETMKVSDFLGDPAALLEKDFVRKLSEDANFTLASTTMLVATKPRA
jgi:SAM-dependent methyltransferase